MENHEKKPSPQQPEQNKKDSQDKKPLSSRSPWIALSGAGIQMGVTVFLAAWLGKYLDGKYPSESGKNWFTIGLTIFGVAISLYNLLRQVNQINNRSDKKDS